jgi:hypothetical protein
VSSALPEHIVAQMRWLVENRHAPDRHAAAMALVDELSAWVSQPDGFKSRRQVEHELEAARECGREIFQHTLSFRPTDSENRAWEQFFPGGRVPPFVVTVGDRAWMKPADQRDAISACLDALRHFRLPVDRWLDDPRTEFAIAERDE